MLFFVNALAAFGYFQTGIYGEYLAAITTIDSEAQSGWSYFCVFHGGYFLVKFVAAQYSSAIG